MRYRFFGLFFLAVLLSLGLLVACGRVATPTPTATPPRPTPTPPAPTPTPPPAETPVGPPLIPHTLEGRESCLSCHQIGGVPLPEDHEGRTEDLCLTCHEPQ
jgi:predicted CXXCH cytochrome family protein